MSSIRLKPRQIIQFFIIFILVWIIINLTSEKTHSIEKNVQNEDDMFEKRITREKYQVKCNSIFEMNKKEIQKAKEELYDLHTSRKLSLVKEEHFIFEKKFCSLYKSLRGYNRHTYSSNFSIAYSILTYTDTEQFERLLRLIYHSDNIYCIHIDSKSQAVFKETIKSIVNCFDNVFISTKSENVIYASYNRLQADINCLNDLFNLESLVKENKDFKGKRVVKWDYFLNYASSEFPLRTNKELVQILKMYHGSNEIEIIKKFNKKRIQVKWIVDLNKNVLYATNETKSNPPHNFNIVKGYAYVALSRKFSQYAVFNQKAKDLLEWSKDTWSPDEWYWSTLQFNTNYYNESGFKDEESKDRISTMARFAGWGGEYNCKGKWRHGVCVFSIEDLPEMITRPHFVVNKFLLDYDPISYQCMEEWYFKREKIQLPLNMYYYCNFLRPHSTLLDCPNFI